MAFRKTASRRTTYSHYAAPSRRGNSKARLRIAIRAGVVIILIAAVIGGFHYVRHTNASEPPTSASQQTVSTNTTSLSSKQNLQSTSKAETTAVNHCAGNKLSNFILVSVSQRHLWACSGSKTMYSSAVVTGMEKLPADLTPRGTYHIYGKQRNLYLNGSDTTGSWHDYVYYWMPFLSNQYGVYGFHDATWRKPNAFGNIDPNSSNASHGCVETPLATAKWLYNWAPIGTTVTVVS